MNHVEVEYISKLLQAEVDGVARSLTQKITVIYFLRKKTFDCQIRLKNYLKIHWIRIHLKYQLLVSFFDVIYDYKLELMAGECMTVSCYLKGKKLFRINLMLHKSNSAKFRTTKSVN